MISGGREVISPAFLLGKWLDYETKTVERVFDGRHRHREVIGHAVAGRVFGYGVL